MHIEFTFERAARRPARNSAASYVAVKKGVHSSGPQRALSSEFAECDGMHALDDLRDDDLRNVGAIMLAQ